MNLTALEIKQQVFDKSIRGYNANDVRNFLKIVSSEWEHLVSKIKDQEREITQLKDKLKHFQKVEETLHETLESAKASADQRISGAKVESETTIKRAELEAEKIIRDAQEQRREIRLGITQLLDRRQEMIRGMKSYLDMAGESLETFSRDEGSVYQVPEAESIQPPQKEKQPSGESTEDKTKKIEKEPGAENGEGEEEKKVKYFSPDTDDMDDLINEIN